LDEKAAALLPDNWHCAKHDKSLLIAASYNGFDSLKNLSYNKEYGFEEIEITPDVAVKRIEEICDFYKGYQQQSKVVKKVKKEPTGSGMNIEESKSF
jgi:hypothetical protein